MGKGQGGSRVGMGLCRRPWWLHTPVGDEAGPEGPWGSGVKSGEKRSREEMPDAAAVRMPFHPTGDIVRGGWQQNGDCC